MSEPQITGGGGHEPDADEEPRGEATTPDPASSVDLKTSELPDPR